jgi:hypothetical protein
MIESSTRTMFHSKSRSDALVNNRWLRCVSCFTADYALLAPVGAKKTKTLIIIKIS